MTEVRSYKILIVDDKPDNLRTLVDQMEQMQHNIQALQETNAKNALDIARMELPDLIVTDWEMPEMDGIEFIRELKSNAKTRMIPVIMCTGIMTSSKNLKTALDVGAVDYIRKPVDALEFQARISSMLQLADSFKTIERQMLVVESQKEALFSEVHHRVKNNLQMIISLMNLQLTNIENKEIEEVLKSNQRRIMAMSLMHKRMHLTADFSAIGLNGYVTDLIDSVRERYAENQVKFEVEISEKIVIHTDTAIPIGLIINEMISNFYKHCSTIEGCRFTVNASQSGDQLTFVYRDNGEGFSEDLCVENINTFGLELMAILMDQLGGEFKFYNDNGAVIELNWSIANND